MYWSRLHNKLKSNSPSVGPSVKIYCLQILFLQINFRNQEKLSLFLPWARRWCHTWYRRLSRTWTHTSPPRSSDNPSVQHCRISTHTETQQFRQTEAAYCCLW